jgi:hypothetical protein
LEFGYLRKGYYNDLTFEGHDGTIYYNSNRYTDNFNTFYLGLSERITFFNSKIRPYLKIGINLQLIPKNELENHSLLVIDKTGEILWIGGPYSYENLDWNNFTLNANVGFGLTYNEILFIEFEYSPAITPLLNTNHIKVHDRYFGLSIGVNINRIF